MKHSNNLIPLISFPRSGNTWLRFILANLFKSDIVRQVDYSNLNLIMPTEREQIKDFDYTLKLDNAPIILKEHYNYYDLNLDFKKSIYIKRNFKDVIQSYWFFTINKEPLLFDNFEEFIKTYWRYCGTYNQHIESLDDIKKSNKKIFVIDYEDLYENTFSTVSSCLQYLEIDYSDQKLKKAIKLSNYNRLKKFQQNIFEKKEIKNLEKILSNHDDKSVNKVIYNRLFNYYISFRFKSRKIKNRL
tara:strand:+ start:14720 stop:15451 length:732 start_codon:yes stop_codon:yes gene_type:complete